MAESNAANRTLPDLVLDIDYTDEESPENARQLNESSNNFSAPCCSKSLKKVPDNQSYTASHQVNNKHNKHVLSHAEDQKPSKVDTKVTPRRSQLSSSKGSAKVKAGAQTNRPCQQHSFLTDITEVRQMEQGLLKLLDDFHSGKLQAFGKDCTFEKMEQVREQQERLARLHFELNTQQEIYGPQSDDGRRMGRDNLGKLIENLQQLSHSIEQLQVSSPSVQTDV